MILASHAVYNKGFLYTLLMNKISYINYVRQDEEFSNISSHCMRVLLLLLFIKKIVQRIVVIHFDKVS